ncbi:B56 [miniopterid betaherpesvirus 1]|uniref:B56 n=1 Tax=miniopterid betaherpesvirus 1 TaxID=3070189 RepID=I3VQ43_9BETA|nr:B56 [miniopterid betaherpesvirus 1]AFK83887.1 B56 [miniopterid betaherpesvirus 1]
MNTLQKLCVVCSKCNECAMEVECLRYCDPNIVLAECSPFKRNALTVMYLYRKLHPSLVNQNKTLTSTLTLYMEILLRSLYEDVLLIDEALEEFSTNRDPDAYYRKVLRLDRCDRHDTVRIRFTERVELSVSLATLNDVERLICKINCVYGTIQPEEGLEICRRLLSFLGLLCGISPVASPEVYAEATTCLQCYEEQCTVPNQGRSIARRLQGLLCDHITVRKPLVQLETDIQTTEQDILETVGRIPRICGIVSAIRSLSSLSPASHTYINEAEEALRDYNLFTEIPEQIYSLSDFTYWSKTSEVIVKHVGVTMRHLNLHHGLCKALRNELSQYLYGEPVADVLSKGEERLAEHERLYAGSVFAAPGKVVDLITSLSIKAFEGNPVFNRLQENNETYAKIRTLIEEIRRPRASMSERHQSQCRASLSGTGCTCPKEAGRNPGGERRGGRGEDPGADGAERAASADGAERSAAAALERGDPFVKSHDVEKEVSARKRAYLQKVSEVGYNKVMRCIKSQEHLITKLIDVNLVGTVCLEALSRVMNGFLLRSGYRGEVAARDVGEQTTYDDHLYVVNNLVHRRLSSESLPQLGQQIYGMLNGPLFVHHRDYYPLPNNIDMAYACDNAGMLPHMKEDLVRCAEGTIYPNEWMVTEYKKFFSFDEVSDLNALQRRYWCYVRELVLSLALYNEAFGKRLTLKRGDCAIDSDAHCLILTYNVDRPLFLRVGERAYSSTDLYLLLYKYLVETGEGREGIDDARPERSAREPSDRRRSVVLGPESGREGFSNGVRRDGREERARGPVSLLDLVRCVDDDVFIPGCLFDGDADH